jgi:amino acid transporter
LNVTMIVGAGVFITIPLMLQELPGPYALLGWVFAGVLMIFDGMIWSELGAALPGSGGSYVYLLESYGRERWGRLMAFLFIWQFLISGPLEVATGLISIAQFSNGLSPELSQWNETLRWRWPAEGSSDLFVTFDPSRGLAFCIGLALLWLLYRRIVSLGRWTVTFWIGVLAIIGIILVEGWSRFQPSVAFAKPEEPTSPLQFVSGLGAAMILAMYSYLGYYNVCYIGDEVSNPGRTIPRAIFLSALLVCVLFIGLHLAMLGTVPWQEVPREKPAIDNYNLPAEFMRRLHGEWAAALVSLMLIWSCAGSVFASLLGYSRIPYGAARFGHFFSVLGKVHPAHQIPHVSLLLVGGLTLFWSLFELQSVINALLTTRILEQFLGQVVGVILLRRSQPDLPRPYRMWLYPLPCALALVGWVYMYVAAGWPFILIGLGTLTAGTGVFLLWSRRRGQWPFGGSDVPQSGTLPQT